MTGAEATAEVDRGEPVLVAGAGAVGSVIGGLLAARGWPVTLVGRPEHLEAVRRDGLRIEGLFGEHCVRDLDCVTDVLALRGTFRVVLLTVKSWDTAAMTFAVEKRLASDGHVLSLQNGLGNLERVAAIVGARRVLGGRVIFGAELLAPGRVRVTVEAAPVLIGSPDPHDVARVAAAARWAAALADAGVPARGTPAIVAELWAKALYNAALNPMGALLGVPYGHLPADRDARAVMDDVLHEAFAVARAADVGLPWPDADAYGRRFYGDLVPSTAGHRSSMLQDLERGRPTEIDAINGYLVQQGERHGVATPVNATLARVMRARVRLERDRVMRPLALTRPTLDAVLAHARETGAEECCGAVVTRDGRERVMRFVNVQNELHAREPATYTRTAESAYTPRADAYELLDAAERGGERLAVLYHSHPKSGSYFSAEDRARAMFGDEPAYPDVTYVVVSDAWVSGEARAFRWHEPAGRFVEVSLEVREP
jgi:2-dehydropantoate 2-reductase